jgi:hypothetical protein
MKVLLTPAIMIFSMVCSTWITCAADGLDLSGWHLVQEGAHHEFVIPEGTVVESNGYVVVARNSSKEEFELFWGVSLPDEVVFLDSGNSVPKINGDEYFLLLDSGENVIDGPTVAMAEGADESVQRNNPGDPPDEEGSWTRGDPDTFATPGSGAGVPGGAGIVINEFSDALGSGNYIYEFVELFNDDETGVNVLSWGTVKSVVAD